MNSSNTASSILNATTPLSNSWKLLSVSDNSASESPSSNGIKRHSNRWKWRCSRRNSAMPSCADTFWVKCSTYGGSDSRTLQICMVRRTQHYKLSGRLRRKTAPKMCREHSPFGKTISAIKDSEGRDARNLSGNHTPTSWPKHSKLGKTLVTLWMPRWGTTF